VFDGNIKTNLKQVATRAGHHFPEPAISFDLRSSQYSYLALQPL